EAEQGSGGEDPGELEFELPLQGKMRRRLSLYGAAVRSSGFLDVGEVRQGVSKSIRVHLKVRDPDQNLQLDRAELSPSFLTATVSPQPGWESGQPVPGLYDLVLTVPADAPVCSYLADDRMGQVRIVSKHPRLPETALGIRFVVLPQ